MVEITFRSSGDVITGGLHSDAPLAKATAAQQLGFTLGR